MPISCSTRFAHRSSERRVSSIPDKRTEESTKDAEDDPQPRPNRAVALLGDLCSFLCALGSIACALGAIATAGVHDACGVGARRRAGARKRAPGARPDVV